jgi:hypothetical protein
MTRELTKFEYDILADIVASDNSTSMQLKELIADQISFEKAKKSISLLSRAKCITITPWVDGESLVSITEKGVRIYGLAH